MQDPRVGPSGGGFAIWLMPDADSAAVLSTVIAALAKTPSKVSPDPDARDLSIFDPHLTLFVPVGKAATDAEFFKAATRRAVAKLRQKAGVPDGQAADIRLELDDPAAGLGWWNPVHAPVTQTSDAAKIVYLRKIIEWECGEAATPTGWFPFIPDNEWCPLFPLAYTDPDWHWEGLDAIGIRADMVVLASKVARFPMTVRCKSLALVDLRGQVDDWKVLSAIDL